MSHAAKLKTAQTPGGKGPSPEPFVLTIVGGLSRKILAVHKLRKVRARRPGPQAQEDHCDLCDAVITRFDGEVFAHTGRCQPCDQALAPE